MKTARTDFMLFLVGAGALAATGCAPPESPDVAEVSQEIGGVEGMLEYAIDAPWRIEPASDGTYGAIPIQLTVHDVDMIGRDTGNWPDAHRDNLEVSQFCDLTVREFIPGGTVRARIYQMSDLEEVERGFRWMSPQDSGRTPPPTGQEAGKAITWYSTCRPGTQDCSASVSLAGTSEWHASAWYAPATTSAGADVVLEMEARFSNVPGNCRTDQGKSPYFSFKNYARVHLGEAQLPRFDIGSTVATSRWLYGDLHYHSQGTDNEGESGYNYRGVVRAMGALGLDFAFATEHASNATQIMDLDLVSDWSFADEDRSGLRDMSDARFRFLLGKLTGVGGVNREAALRAAGTRKPQTHRSHGLYPQIFLGGELDAIPEIPRDGDTIIAYGNGLTFDIRDLWLSGVTGENDVRTSTGRLVQDLQGSSKAFSRQHLVYLPRSSSNADGFIPSNTSAFGGATRRLAEAYEGSAPLLPEIETKGYAFLAHHLNTSGVDRGPSSPPWSEFMLDKAWRSPAILGLEFWNEPVHLETEIEECGDPIDTIIPCEEGFHTYHSLFGIEDDSPRSGLRSGDFMLRPWWGMSEAGYLPSAKWTEAVSGVETTLHHGAASWDRLLLKGLDPRETASLPWLAPGEPRRFFMAGGSDAHGDLNYRREGYMTGTDKVTDVAIGKARNLVFAGAPELAENDNTPLPEGGSRHSQEQVVTALKDGHFLVTDGPILRIAINRNGNAVIDNGDVMMGGVQRTEGETQLPLLLEWKSTSEFGAIEAIDLYVGVASADGTETRVYAPSLHGPRAGGIPGDTITASSIERGVLIQKMADSYYKKDSLRTMTGGSGEGGFSGTKSIALDLTQFPVAGRTPHRVFIRAFARTAQRNPVACSSGNEDALRTGQCIRHYAFTNPIWAVGPIDGVAYDRNDIGTPLLSNWCGHAGSTSGTADFNDDNKLDVWCHDPMVAGGLGRTWVALSTGTSYVARPGTSLYDPWLSSWCGSPGETFGVADFDEDGDDDLWCRGAPGTAGGGKVWVARSTGSGFTTGGPLVSSWCGSATEAFGVADFDGDNGADLYCRDTLGTQGRLWVARSTRSGFTTGAPWISNWCGSSGETLGVGDFNGDSKADLYCYSTSTGTGRTWVALSTGSGFTAGANGNMWTPWISGWCGHPGSGFGVADFTGDGKTDLYCNDGVGSAGNVWVAVSAGTSLSSNAWQPWATNWCSHAGTSFGTGDMDGDRAADLLCRDFEYVWVGLSNKVNGFEGDPFVPKLRGWCTFEQFGLTDLDGDGAADPICRDLTGGLGRIWVALTRHWRWP